MVRIRFRRVGSRNQPSFRIVAADRESPRDGRFLEILGHYNPRTEPATVQVDEARLFHWLEHGAQPSRSVKQALNTVGTWERWERYKEGESLETLLAEAEQSLPEVDPRTRRDDLMQKRAAEGGAKAKPKAEAEVEQPEEAVEATAEEISAEEEEAEEEEEEPEASAEAEADEEAEESAEEDEEEEEEEEA